MAKEDKSSLKEMFMHLAVSALIAAFISAIIGFLLSFATLVFLIISGVFCLLALVAFILSRKYSNE